MFMLLSSMHFFVGSTSFSFQSHTIAHRILTVFLTILLVLILSATLVHGFNFTNARSCSRWFPITDTIAKRTLTVLFTVDLVVVLSTTFVHTADFSDTFALRFFHNFFPVADAVFAEGALSHIFAVLWVSSADTPGHKAFYLSDTLTFGLFSTFRIALPLTTPDPIIIMTLRHLCEVTNVDLASVVLTFVQEASTFLVTFVQFA